VFKRQESVHEAKLTYPVQAPVSRRCFRTMSKNFPCGSSHCFVATPRCLALLLLLTTVIAVSSRSLKSINRGAPPPALSNNDLRTNVPERHQESDLKELRRRCIQVTGGACKTMEAYNLAKLQQSAMPMEWGKRSGAESEAPILETQSPGQAVIGADQMASSPRREEAKALLFFLRPQMKV